jgi:hypothetical protein
MPFRDDVPLQLRVTATELRRSPDVIGRRILRTSAVLVTLAAPLQAAGADQIFFPATDDVTSLIVARINAETVRLDISAWYLSEHTISIAIANRFAAGVPVRLIGDRGAIFEVDPNTKSEFYWLASQGVPIRLRENPTWYPEIDHWKAAIFVGQNLVEFGSANWTPFELAPSSATNYDDETTMFTDDPVLVNAFKTKFDRIWNDTAIEPESIAGGPPYFKNWYAACAAESGCSDYRTRYPVVAPMNINTSRLEPDNPMPADLIWGQGPDFNNRLVTEINNEPSSVSMVIYRLTVDSITDALLQRWQAGVSVRLIVEPSQYLNRQWPEFWLTHANVDRLWAAGVPILQRAHDGLTHMKTLVTSTYATNASSNFAGAWQRDHDYFVSASGKPAIFGAIRNRFEQMWSNRSGFVPFQPQPPDAPTLVSPTDGATGLSTMPTLTWNAAPFAASYDVYLGTSAGNMTLAGNTPAQLVNNPPGTYSWTPSSPLNGSTTYIWQIVARTNATVRDPSLVARSSSQTFATGLPDSLGTLGGADPTVFRTSAGSPQATWWISPSNAGPTSIAWGTYGDVPVPGDYDGDHRADPAVWRPSTGLWYVLTSSSGFKSSFSVAWGSGAIGDVPVPGDYDGDGKTDVAVWRPAQGVWWILLSSSGYTRSIGIPWGSGNLGDIPVPGDFDGDGVTDLAVWRPGTGTWFVLLSSAQFSRSMAISWGSGAMGDHPLVGDFDGDGKADLAVWRPATGTWFVLKSGSNYTSSFAINWGSGAMDDVPVLGDFDGDGRADLTVWRPASGLWYILTSKSGYASTMTMQWGNGSQNDVPIAFGR